MLGTMLRPVSRQVSAILSYSNLRGPQRCPFVPPRRAGVVRNRRVLKTGRDCNPARQASSASWFHPACAPSLWQIKASCLVDEETKQNGSPRAGTIRATSSRLLPTRTSTALRPPPRAAAPAASTMSPACWRTCARWGRPRARQRGAPAGARTTSTSSRCR